MKGNDEMLRKLMKKDAPLMLEWMHDPDVTEWMDTDFGSKTLEDCQRFIEMSADESKHIHRAIVDDLDTYMGTVSLKNIDRDQGHAEFAITIRKGAMGKDYARQGMADILRYGREELQLNEIYWYVNRDNRRAVRFYDKNGYPRVDVLPAGGFSPEKYIFYSVR